MIGVLLAAGLAACSVMVLSPSRTSRQRLRVGRSGMSVASSADGGGPQDGRPPLSAAGPPTRRQWGGVAGRTARRAAAGAVGVGAGVLVGGPVGLVLGGLVALGVGIGLGRLETAAQRRERRAIAADAPVVAELLSAALSAGVPVESAVPVVADAVGGPLGDRLQLVSRLLALGQPGDSAWARLGAEESLRPLVAACRRSARTGAPLAGLLAGSAEELRQQAQDTARAEIRAAGVKALLPLGLCQLPAFLLLGVVPLVGGLVARIWG